MSKNNYIYRDKPSAAVIALNVVIIVLLCAVIIAMGIYLYVYYTGNKITFLNFDSSPELNVITSATESISLTEMTTVATTAETEVPTFADATSVDETTVSKYTSTEYDKEFFENFLFVGDSIFTGLSGYGYCLPENVFAQVGLNPDSIFTKQIEDVTAVDKAKQMQPEKICIMLVTNGLAFLETDYMAQKMGDFVKQLKDVCPDADIILLSIPPVTEEHEKDNPEKIPIIEDYNSKLKEVADEVDCFYIDIFTMLQDESGYLSKDYAESDGLHFLGKAYQTMLSRIQYEFVKTENDEAVITETELSETTMEETTVEEVTEYTYDSVTEAVTGSETEEITESAVIIVGDDVKEITSEAISEDIIEAETSVVIIV